MTQDPYWLEYLPEDAKQDALKDLQARSAEQKGVSNDVSRNHLVDIDRARLALFNAIQAIKIGNPTDDKLILDNLREAGFWICHLPAEPAGEEPVAFVCEADLRALATKPDGDDMSISPVPRPEIGMKIPLYAHPPTPAADEAVTELRAMLNPDVQADGCAVFDHTPEEIGEHVMEHYKEIRAAIAGQQRER